jgi:hypothetical protein
MRKALAAAVVIATFLILPARAENEFETAGGFVEAYSHGDNVFMRLYIRGIGDGLSIYNTLLHTQGVALAYCPPEKVGLVDAQYVAIMRGFMDKFPKTRTSPVPAVLIYALQDAFPCK